MFEKFQEAERCVLEVSEQSQKTASDFSNKLKLAEKALEDSRASAKTLQDRVQSLENQKAAAELREGKAVQRAELADKRLASLKAKFDTLGDEEYNRGITYAEKSMLAELPQIEAMEYEAGVRAGFALGYQHLLDATNQPSDSELRAIPDPPADKLIKPPMAADAADAIADGAENAQDAQAEVAIESPIVDAAQPENAPKVPGSQQPLDTEA